MLLAAGYILWILAGVVAWVGHIGEDAAAVVRKHGPDAAVSRWTGRIAEYLPAGGGPEARGRGQTGGAAVETLSEFFLTNGPRGLLFIAQHSILSIRQLEKMGLATVSLLKHVGVRGTSSSPALPPGGARLLYNFMSALVLHHFLLEFAPYRPRKHASAGDRSLLSILQQPPQTVLTLPAYPDTSDVPLFWLFSPLGHFLFGFGCMAFAMVCFVCHPQTWALLGVAQLLGWKGRSTLPGPRMDAITWMGQLVYRSNPQFGPFAFVLFSGLSIIPRNCTCGDLMVRFFAALYLRFRSPSFRDWVATATSSSTKEEAPEKQQGGIEGTHMFAWVLRTALVVSCCWNWSWSAIGICGGGAAALVTALWAAERYTLLGRLQKS